MKYVNKDKLLDSLFERCSSGRNKKTEDVTREILSDMDLIISNQNFDKLVEIIRPYKMSSKNLEETLNQVHKFLSEDDTPWKANYDL